MAQLQMYKFLNFVFMYYELMTDKCVHMMLHAIRFIGEKFKEKQN
jgi:hypothetical protein